MSKSVRISWGLLTLLPIVYFLFFISFVTSIDHSQPAADLEEQFKNVFKLHIVTMVLMVALIASYIVYLFKSGVVPKDKKALWCVVLVAGNMFAMPLFWFFYVWRAPFKNSAE